MNKESMGDAADAARATGLRPQPASQSSQSGVPIADDGETASDPNNTADFAAAVAIAADLYNAAELAVWLTAPQPLLDGWTPIQLLGCGKAHKLVRALKQLEDGVYI